MQLHRLTLRAPLAFERLSVVPEPTDAFYETLGADEAIFSFDPAAVIRPADDGPTVVRPLPPPAFAARKAAAADQGDIRVDSGEWLFSQARRADFSELADYLEWFLRDAWWEREEDSGPIILRLVREDAATAWQLLRRL